MRKGKKAPKKTKKQPLPESFRPYFWSYRFSALDVVDDRDLIIKQLFAWGTIEDLSWMIRQYGIRTIRSVLSSTPRTELRPSLAELAKVAFDVTSMPNARRVPHKRR